MNPERIDPARSEAAVNGPGDDCGQRLSCLLDGELEPEACRALLERLRHDEEACRHWVRLNCVGDAMRSADVAAWHSDRFVARVSAALEREPTVLAPAAAPRSAARRWLLPGAGAVAAAAVLIAVVLPTRQPSSPEGLVARAPAAVTAPTVSPVRIEVDRSPRLERYLAAHRELAEPSVMPNSTPYVRTSGAMLAEEGR